MDGRGRHAIREPNQVEHAKMTSTAWLRHFSSNSCLRKICEMAILYVIITIYGKTGDSGSRHRTQRKKAVPHCNLRLTGASIHFCETCTESSCEPNTTFRSKRLRAS